MGLPTFFKIPGHKTFRYMPRYFDPEKERRKERMEEMKDEPPAEKSDDRGKEEYRSGQYASSIREKFRNQHSRPQKTSKSSNIRLIIILLFLISITLYLLLS